ncbi:MAG: hypothetical protein ACOY5B_05310 [Spirochaetota bacterium]
MARAFLFVLLALGCSRKAEIVPGGATHVTRSDSVAESEGLTFELRSYTFQLKLTGGEASFVCEAKKFASATDALVAAEKSIAQRPDEQQKNNSAWYARAGLSQWLLTGRTLTWCMLSSTGNSVREAAQAKLREAFLKKFSEAS